MDLSNFQEGGKFGSNFDLLLFGELVSGENGIEQLSQNIGSSSVFSIFEVEYRNFALR